ncbi:hypothetical protein [uncultured Cohaesibacter sp.]|uniref:hypothetical protein n=1 Tax=uncultured Cohaesibacter sp. TaxID=1002546 RepID=UPI0029C78F41|nr:hypothetical protein [uncultured Cohaesibacter sp.]
MRPFDGSTAHFCGHGLRATAGKPPSIPTLALRVMFTAVIKFTNFTTFFQNALA